MSPKMSDKPLLMRFANYELHCVHYAPAVLMALRITPTAMSRVTP